MAVQNNVNSEFEGARPVGSSTTYDPDPILGAERIPEVPATKNPGGISNPNDRLSEPDYTLPGGGVFIPPSHPDNVDGPIISPSDPAPIDPIITGGDETPPVEDVTNSAIKDKLIENTFDPQLPESARQSATPIVLQDEETISPAQFQIGEQERIEASGYEAAQAKVASAIEARDAEMTGQGYISPATAAAYRAATSEFATAEAAMQGRVSKLASGSTASAAVARAAIQDLNDVDPKTQAKAITKDMPLGATVEHTLGKLLEGLETDNIPSWAKPAIAAAEARLAAAGLSTSSVGKNSMYNAIIQSAMPIAQQDAQSRLSVFQQNLSNEQQAMLANSTFFQNLTMKNLDNKQQAAIVNATNATNASIASAQNRTQASISNAQAFLQMDISNLNNAQQSNIINAQMEQQALLSNQSAINTSKQFNAANAQQASQFNTNLEASAAQFNATQSNAMSQFNAGQTNQISQFNANLEASASQFNTGQANQASQFSATASNAMKQFNTQIGFNRDQFNTQNATAIEQSNVQWRRQMNQINTAGTNAVNQANAMNQFNLSNQALTFLWQEQRDAAKWANDNTQNDEERRTRMAIAALGNESIEDSVRLNNIKALASAAASIFDSWGSP